MTVRFLKPEDLEAVYSIFCYYIDHSVANFSWTRPDYEEFCAKQLAMAKSYPYLVAEYEGKIIGFGYAHKFLARDAYQYDAELTIYFAQGNHHGLTHILYEKLEAILKEMGICRLISCTTATNQESLAYQAKHGFEEFGLLKNAGFKQDAFHDVAWLVKVINPTTKPWRKTFSQVRKQFETNED